MDDDAGEGGRIIEAGAYAGSGGRRDRESRRCIAGEPIFEQLPVREAEHRRQAGGSAGSGDVSIVLEKERGHDFRRFLKRFAVQREEMCLDMDSFDYIPYDYSRRMYDRLVFLEPLEYREMRKLQEFVIAIDTSGSCSGEIVRSFLEETWEILSERENFFREMEIHIIQCDCLIQEHVRITCEEGVEGGTWSISGSRDMEIRISRRFSGWWTGW